MSKVIIGVDFGNKPAAAIAPDPRGEPLTPEQWDEFLFELHGRLYDSLSSERPSINEIPMVISIDDVVALCQLIEGKLGTDWFDDEPA